MSETKIYFQALRCPVMYKTALIFVVIAIFMRIAGAADWYRISGSFAIVEYPQGLKPLADSLLKTADYALPKLAEMAGISAESFRKEKAEIVLSQSPDVSNGYALNNRVVIYALSSAYIPLWTGRQNWYQQVLTHELAHTVTFRALRRKVNFIGNLPWLFVPRWFMEGIAQYFSEEWNAYRGDLYLKNAVMYGRFTMQSINSLQDGRLLYAGGHALIRYLASQYGDSSLIKLMRHDSTSFFYSFDSAFKKTYKQSLSELFPSFIRHLILHYGDKLADIPVNRFGKKFPAFGYDTYQIIPLQEADSTFCISALMNNNHLFSTARVVKINKKKIESLQEISSNYSTGIITDKTQRLFAFGRTHFGIEDNLQTIGFDWFVYDRETETTKKIASNRRARFVAFRGQSALIMIEVLPQGSQILEFDLQSGEERKLFETAFPLGRIEALSDGRFVIDGQGNDGNRDLFLFDGGSLQPLTHSETDDRNAVAVNDSLILFNRFTGNEPSVAVINLHSGEEKTVLTDQFEYWVHSYDGRTNSVILKHWKPGRKRIFSSVPLDSLLMARKVEFAQKETAYTRWTSKKPMQPLLDIPALPAGNAEPEKVRFPHFPLQHGLSLALPWYSDNYGWGVYGLTFWAEMLQRQALMAMFVAFPSEPDRSLGSLAHMIRTFDMDILNVYYHGPLIFSQRNGTRVDYLRDLAAVQFTKPVWPGGDKRCAFFPRIGVSWQQFKLKEVLPAVPRLTSFGTVRIGAAFEYHQPTKLYPFLPRKQFGLSFYWNKSFSGDTDFSVFEINTSLSHNLLLENLGLKLLGSWIKQQGQLPPLQFVGTDRFFETNIPRDFGFTRTVRGVREDNAGDELLWGSAEVNFFLAKKTPFRLLFLPLSGMAVTGFIDYARISGIAKNEIYSYGYELTFGDPGLRFGGGFARGRQADGSHHGRYYIRITLTMADLLRAQHISEEIPANRGWQ